MSGEKTTNTPANSFPMHVTTNQRNITKRHGVAHPNLIGVVDHDKSDAFCSNTLRNSTSQCPPIAMCRNEHDVESVKHSRQHIRRIIAGCHTNHPMQWDAKFGNCFWGHLFKIDHCKPRPHRDCALNQPKSNRIRSNTMTNHYLAAQ